MLERQVAGLLIRDGRVLLCLRSATRSYYPGVWDLPGGHVEPGESDMQALHREIEEELGIALTAPSLPPFARLTDEALGFDLKVWVLRHWCGEPENKCPAEHDRIAWLSCEDARALPLALPHYRDLIERAVSPGWT